MLLSMESQSIELHLVCLIIMSIVLWSYYAYCFELYYLFNEVVALVHIDVGFHK